MTSQDAWTNKLIETYQKLEAVIEESACKNDPEEMGTLIHWLLVATMKSNFEDCQPTLR